MSLRTQVASLLNRVGLGGDSSWAFFCCSVIGTGTDEDAFRPKVGDEPGVEGYACCYEQPDEQRVIVLVKAPQATLDALAATYELIYTAEEVQYVG